MFEFERSFLKTVAGPEFGESRGIRFQDVDAAGIIFYARLFDMCHDVWVRFLEGAGHSMASLLASRELIFPIRHVSADYFKPMRFGDPVQVALVAAHLETSETTLGFRFARQDTGEVCAVAQSIHVSLDPGTFSRVEVPGWLRAALARFPGSSEVRHRDDRA